MTVSLVDEYLSNLPRKERPEGILYVTDLVKPCQKSAYMDIVDPKEYSVESQRVFESGRLIEDWWVHVLERTPGLVVLGKQLPARYVDGGLEIHGRVDALCQHENRALVVHEVKSAKSTGYISAPKEEHLLQVQFYLGCLSVDWGQVDYLDKRVMLQGDGVSVEKCFTVERDPGMFAEMVRRGRVLSEAVKVTVSPQGNPCWLCDYCLHKEDCVK
jgi:hypothetical protein